MKKTYKLPFNTYKEGSTYALLKISMVQHFLELHSESDIKFKDDGVEWHDVGESMWAWIESNDSLDVNEPVTERYDLYIAKTERKPPELAAALVKNSKGGYYGYLYNREKEELRYVRAFKANELEDAKNTLRVLTAMDNNEE